MVGGWRREKRKEESGAEKRNKCETDSGVHRKPAERVGSLRDNASLRLLDKNDEAAIRCRRDNTV